MEFVQPIRDPKQIQAIKAILKGKSQRDYVLFVTGINTGLRISDLLNLTVGEVWQNGKPAEYIEIREQKTDKSKRFIFNKTSQKALKEYDYLSTAVSEAPLFPSRKGNKAISRVQAYRIINQAAEQAGMNEQIGTHTLRKTWAYHAYQAGVDLSLIQQVLNHSAPSVTLRYIGITQDDIDRVYESINL